MATRTPFMIVSGAWTDSAPWARPAAYASSVSSTWTEGVVPGDSPEVSSLMPQPPDSE